MEVLRQFLVMICCFSSITLGWRMPYLGQNLDKMGIVKNKKYEVIRQKVEEDTNIDKKSDIAKAYEDGFKAALDHKLPDGQAASAVPAQVMRFFQTSQIPDAQTAQINQVAFYDPLLINGRNEKRNRIAAPLPRNYYENIFPGFKMSSPPGKKVAAVISRPGNRIETRETSRVQTEKRTMIERLNYAARHRNVILDSVGANPYGGASSVLTRSRVTFHRRKGKGKRDTSENK